MKFEPNFDLGYNDVIILKKKKGHKIIEFSRHKDPVLDDIIELWDYDSRKSSKGKSTWIISKDLHVFLNSYISSGNYDLVEQETIPNKKSKKE